MSKTILSNYCQLLLFQRAEMLTLIEFLKLLAPLGKKRRKGGEKKARCNLWLRRQNPESQA